MGRSQSFDTTTVVQAARDVFWDQGLDGASLPDLERATGLNRSSLYHAFGSKRGLFDAAVEDYLDTVIRPRLRPLVAAGQGSATVPEAGRAVVTYFDRLASAVGQLPADSPRLGCLLVGCATGAAGHDEALRAAVEAYRAELSDALAGALRAADPALADDAVERRARLLLSLQLSALALARVNQDEAVAMLRAARDQAAEWVPRDA
ncbi:MULTISPECIES: TetR/AcrR family transcriptional regulator [Oerskovia]|uniref:TetR/AcrR family transcriptional regulator n=2 Tax=Oerskovia TaxID=162491 RepID=A0ABR8V479_9CELL|nr:MULTISPECIES: TetR/AcrR family transcriptional regulator [Oerskovia]MBD7999480.1 TetR/AcrR family transcriptional regulator [Oerskovia gallyi]MBM7495399.1 AcrR family transcriptional regulator [Oerskovia paurometabola]